MVLHHLVLQCLLSDALDPLQFVTQATIGLDDGIILMLHRAYTQLDRTRRVRVMYFTFFSTIQPPRLVEKLSGTQSVVLAEHF